ncbi:PglD-related sugar-binding protein [Hymenobacter baengnokdamensis]|uniref:PglD-related sugar-binding protein n=1 Tax=Hymenobacter baengnokdamensis TaxID=2615203 RepID=UPI001246CE43|nr:transferase [Hymenobacter baengnokdamensis]
MLILGARGHAIELLQVLESLAVKKLCFFDNVNNDAPTHLYGKYPVLHSASEAIAQLHQDVRVVIGIGGGYLRERLARQAMDWGGVLHTVVAATAQVGRHEVVLEPGLNVMDGALISNEVIVGEGSLVNARAALHHNVVVGRYCEISPGAQLLGHVRVGDFAQVGAGAIILPRVTIGVGAVVGAGAVVTRHVGPYEIVVGIPARAIRKQAADS